MGKYIIETDQGKFEVQTDEPTDTHPALPETGNTLNLAEKASQFVQPAIGPGQGVVQSAGQSAKEMFAPTADTLKRAINPNIGQAGILRPLEQAGQNVGQAVRSSLGRLPKPMQLLPPVVAMNILSDALTPTAFQQQAGVEGIVPGVEGAVRGAGKAEAYLGQGASGVHATDLQKVVDRPGLYAEGIKNKLTPGNQVREAGAQLGQATKDAGFVNETAVDPQRLKEMNPRFRPFVEKQNPFTGKGSIAEQYFDRVKSGDNLTLPETYDAYQATRDVLKKATRKDAVMSQFSRSLQDELKSASSAYKQAAALYERAATGEKVTNLLPRTETGKPSLGRMGFMSLLTGPLAPITASPILHGGISAGFGVASKTAGMATRAVPSVLRRYLDKTKK